MDTPLIDMLDEYRAHQHERWHTPGHKGINPPRGDFLDWSFDITEIGPMHETPNPLDRSQRLMAEAFGSRRTWYSVQGATLGVMVAILAANPPGSTLWIDRSLHRSVLGALMIGGYQVRWLWPSVLAAGLPLPLDQFPESFSPASGLVLSRPTYDGLAGSIESVVTRAHRQGLTVVVDEAHGSHWRAGGGFPTSALRQGADLVVHGVHKSEAALTQTGLLHLNGTRVNEHAIEQWMSLLSTSSPSYLLLASLDRLQWERHQPDHDEVWQGFAARMQELWNTLEKRGVGVLQAWTQRSGWQADPARLTILGPGREIESRVQTIGELEKTSPGSATFFLAPGQDLERLTYALIQTPWPENRVDWESMPWPQLQAAMSVRETWGRASRWVPLEESVDQILAAAVTPYPPGIPVGVPGEIVSVETRDWIREWHRLGGGHVDGLRQEDGQSWLLVVA